jgi:hypothetical protein
VVFLEYLQNGWDFAVNQGIDQILLAKMFEKVLLAPAFEHAIGNDESA